MTKRDMCDLSACAVTDVGISRFNNQDNFVCDGYFREDPAIDKLMHESEMGSGAAHYFAVMDGMGGLKHGETASLIAATEFVSQVRASVGINDDSGPGSAVWTGSQVDNDLGDLIMCMNEAICAEMSRIHRRMGSTAVIARVSGGGIRFANIGDSRGYIFHNGSLRQMSVDHTEHASLMRMRQAMGIEDDSVPEGAGDGLTQYLGIDEEMFIIEPEVSEAVEFCEGDVAMLCSDGLSSVLSEEDIAHILSGDDPRSMAKKLVKAARKARSSDNITVVVVRRNR